MPNDYFQFKQFIIYQHKCAMKVCTDACLFGAFVAQLVQHEMVHNKDTSEPNTNNLPNDSSLLRTPYKVADIGTGTGLLSMMLAQKTNAIIDAIEMDDHAAQQATENIAASPWAESIHVHHTTIQEFARQADSNAYDFIISNPPFFENDLKSSDSQRNMALHSDSLSLTELLDAIKQLLKADGSFAILLPFHRTQYFKDLAVREGYHLRWDVAVKQTEKHQPFRSILWFGTDQQPLQHEEIIIKEKGQYSEQFIVLLKDYYLHL